MQEIHLIISYITLLQKLISTYFTTTTLDLSHKADFFQNDRYYITCQDTL